MNSPEHSANSPLQRQILVLLIAVSFLFSPLTAVRAQTQTQTPFSVKGVVTNEYGNPEPGVSVSEKGRTTTDPNGTATTDAKGQYTIQVSSGSATLVFRKGYRYDEAPVNSLSVINRTLRCQKGTVLSGNVCVIPGEAFLPACPAGQVGALCLPKVEYHPAVGVSMNDARSLSIKNGWVMATAEEVTAAWKEQKLDVFAYGMLADGRYALPVQADHPPTFKKGPNIGITGGDQGFFYVLKSAVSRTQVPPDPTPVAKSTAPSTTLNIGLNIMTPEEQKEYAQRWWTRVMKDPALSSLRYDLICDSTPENAMLDGWSRAERPMLIEAAKLLLAREGTPATNQAIHDLNVQLTKDPVRRWQFAPFMLRTLWDALVAKNPTQAQDIFRTKLEAKIACADTKYAKTILELWNRHIGKSNAIGDGNDFWLGKVDPPKSGATFSNLLDTRTGGSIDGFAEAGAFDNPAGIPEVGGPAVAMLYTPMLYNAFPDVEGDTEELAPLGADMKSALIHMGFTTSGVGILLVSSGPGVIQPLIGYSETLLNIVDKKAGHIAKGRADYIKQLASEASKEAGEFNPEKQAILDSLEAGDEAPAAAAEKQAGKRILKTVFRRVVFGKITQKIEQEAATKAGQIVAEKAGQAVAEKITEVTAEQLAKAAFPAVAAVVGVVLTAAEIFGTAVSDRVRTDQFDKTVNERANNVNLQDIRESLGDNPTDIQRAAVFNQLVNMVIAEPAARGDLTLALPDIKCNPGTLMSHFDNRKCVSEVKFFSEPFLTFQQARDKAKSQGWDLATQAEVLDAWSSLDFDAYAYGRTAEGTFAVPVQTDHPNFKKGANLGAVGGNQGFFYTVGKVNVATPEGYVRIQNFESPKMFIDVYPNLGVRDPRRNPNASVWKLVPASSGMVRIQSYLGDIFINNQSGALQAGPIQSNWYSALWKLEPDSSGAVRIQNQWYKDRYIYLQNGNLALGPLQPGQKGALWEVRGPENAAAAREDLAKGKRVKQISVYPGGEASKAVDGNTDGNWAHGSVTHTQGQYQSWWVVDLGATYNIDEIRLYNRTDCCSERLNNFRIFVADAKNGAVTYDQGTVFVNSTEFINENPRIFTNHLRGRYVRIQLNGTGFLSLAEVEVYGTP